MVLIPKLRGDEQVLPLYCLCFEQIFQAFPNPLFTAIDFRCVYMLQTSPVS